MENNMLDINEGEIWQTLNEETFVIVSVDRSNRIVYGNSHSKDSGIVGRSWTITGLPIVPVQDNSEFKLIRKVSNLKLPLFVTTEKYYVTKNSHIFYITHTDLKGIFYGTNIDDSSQTLSWYADGRGTGFSEPGGIPRVANSIHEEWVPPVIKLELDHLYITTNNHIVIMEYNSEDPKDGLYFVGSNIDNPEEEFSWWENGVPRASSDRSLLIVKERKFPKIKLEVNKWYKTRGGRTYKIDEIDYNFEGKYPYKSKLTSIEEGGDSHWMMSWNEDGIYRREEGQTMTRGLVQDIIEEVVAPPFVIELNRAFITDGGKVVSIRKTVNNKDGWEEAPFRYSGMSLQPRSQDVSAFTGMWSLNGVSSMKDGIRSGIHIVGPAPRCPIEQLGYYYLENSNVVEITKIDGLEATGYYYNVNKIKLTFDTYTGRSKVAHLLSRVVIFKEPTTPQAIPSTPATKKTSKLVPAFKWDAKTLDTDQYLLVSGGRVLKLVPNSTKQWPMGGFLYSGTQGVWELVEVSEKAGSVSRGPHSPSIGVVVDYLRTPAPIA